MSPRMSTADITALREALQLAAGALDAVSKTLPDRGRHAIRFTGEWASLRSMTISEILDKSDAALEATRP